MWRGWHRYGGFGHRRFYNRYYSPWWGYGYSYPFYPFYGGYYW